MTLGQPVMEVGRCDRSTFETQIRPLNRPVLMKGQVTDWLCVQKARQSDDALIAYLKPLDNGIPAGTMLGPPAIKGEFFYGAQTSQFNFQRGSVPISTALDRLVEQRDKPEPYAIYVQSAPIGDHLPRFMDDQVLDLLGPDVAPRIWIGNALRVQTHHDLTHNIACGVAGRRRFTLFPPEQLTNLYIGPFESTLAGPPVSMVTLEDPDLERYPRFREAEKHAQHADLEPGDALYIPYFWWHHVRSSETFNVLVNYWWKDSDPSLGEPYDVLLHGLLSLRDLPVNEREAWRVMFEHYVFRVNGDPVSHLSAAEQGAAGPHAPDLAKRLRHQLLTSLGAQWGSN